jgi:DNA-binding NarL/FixJ family response regulator
MTTWNKQSPVGTPLTERECEVLLAVCQSKSKETAGPKLGITRHSVHTHMMNIFSSTGTHATPHALTVAVARGDITIPVIDAEPLPKIQQDILVGVALGLNNLQIGRNLHLTRSVLKRELQKAYNTLNAKSRAHLVYLGFHTGNIHVNRRKRND